MITSSKSKLGLGSTITQEMVNKASQKEPTIQVCLPESIAGFCYGIRDEYDSMDDEGKKKVIDALESVLKASQTHFKDNIPFQLLVRIIWRQ